MKRTLLPLAFVAALCAAAPVALADDAPQVSLRDAVTLAEKVLAEKNEPGVYIESVVLTRSSIFNAKRKWFITWSRPFESKTPGTNREVGLSISMDGRAVRVVK